MKELCRTRVGDFDIKDTITVEDLDNEELVIKKLINKLIKMEKTC